MNRWQNLTVVAAVSSSLKLLSRKQRAQFGLFSLSLLTINLFDLGALAVVSIVATISSGASNPNVTLLEGFSTTEILVSGIAIAATLFLVKTLLGIVIAKQRGLFLARIEREATVRISSLVFGKGLERFKRESPADLAYALLHSTGTAFSGILGNALQIFAEITLSVLIVGFFLFVDWQVASLIIIYFAIVIILFQGATKAISTSAGKQIGEGYSEVHQQLNNIVATYKELSVLNRLESLISSIVDSRSKISIAEATQNYLATIPRLIVEMALILGSVGLVGFEFWNQSQPDFGFLAVFILGSFRMMAALLPLQRSYAALRFLAPQSVRAQELISQTLGSDFDELPSTENITNTEIQLQDSGELGLGVQANNLSFSYRDASAAVPAVRDISLTIRPGSLVAIVGPSGAGKSTLVDLLLGLLTPSAGKVLISGWSPAEVRDRFPGIIGYVPQKPGMTSGSIRANVALGLKEEEIDDSLIASALQQASLWDWVCSLPEGIYTTVGAHSDSLSGGQMQRIGLARALYHRPRLLVLDEATSALDPDTESGITESLEKIGTSVTKIVVAHRVSTIQSAETIFALEHGRLLGSGTFSQLRRAVPFFDRYIRHFSNFTS